MQGEYRTLGAGVVCDTSQEGNGFPSAKEAIEFRWEEVFVLWTGRRRKTVHQRRLCGLMDGKQGRP